MHGWRVLIFQNEISGYKYSEPWNSVHNKQFHDKMPNVFRCPSRRKQGENCSSYMMVYDPNSNFKDNKSKEPVFIIETNNATCNWLEPVDFPVENFDLGIDTPKNQDGKLRRLGGHYRTTEKNKKIYGTNTNLFDEMISEDSEPEALKALADPEKRKNVKITHPWGENFGIVRAVLDDAPEKDKGE